MCGRFAQDFSRDEAFKLAHELNVALEWDPAKDLLSDSNIAPHDVVLVVRATTDSLRVHEVTFGIKVSTTTVINARSETVHEKPLFSRLLPKGRCLIPVSGFFEWDTTPQGKVPTFFVGTDTESLYLAAIFDPRRGGAAVVTMPACPPVSLIHNRQPVVATNEEIIGWCENGTIRTPPVNLRGYRVDTKFNSPTYKASL